MISADTMMILTNAIYFKSDWLEQFRSSVTFEEPFFLSNNQQEKVWMMHQQNYFRFFQNNEYKMLEIPYKQAELSFYVILPENMPDFFQRFSVEKLFENVAQMDMIELKVSIPRFKIENKYELVPYLKKLGMNEVFTSSASFNKMFEDNAAQVFISNIIHQTFIEINEQGTEAAAATTIVMRGGCGGQRELIEFTANKPFLFFILEKGSSAILFAGSLMNPRGRSTAPKK